MIESVQKSKMGLASKQGVEKIISGEETCVKVSWRIRDVTALWCPCVLGVFIHPLFETKKFLSPCRAFSCIISARIFGKRHHLYFKNNRGVFGPVCRSGEREIRAM